MRKIRVKLKPQGYDVLIGPGLLARAGEHIAREVGGASGKMLVVSSPQIWALWGSRLQRGLRSAGLGSTTVLIPDGEKYKNLRTIELLAQEFVHAGADRHTAVIAFGGGVVGDVAGFAASIFMRGIPVIQVPTTLLAQVDAAIGGKTGVNLPEGKNLVGTFRQPRRVLCDSNVLSTLSDREYRAGLFEVIKCGVIRDVGLFRFMESETNAVRNRKPELIEEIVRASVAVKAKIVAADERESGLRRILNFGHTVGHALEAATRYRHLLHGEAVGLGMIAAAEIGVATGVTPPEVAARIVDTVMAYGPFPRVTCTSAEVFRHIATDKKSVGGVPHFVLAPAIGKTRITGGVRSAQIAASVRSLREITRRGRQ